MSLVEWYKRKVLVRQTKKRLDEITARLDELEMLLTTRRWGKQAVRGMEYRQAMTPDDPWSRSDREFLKDSEKVEMDALAEEHFTLTQFLSEKGEGSQEYFRPKMHGGVLLGEDSPAAYMSVKHDTSRKIHFEYVEEFDMMVRVINGKWDSDKTQWMPLERWNAQFRPKEFYEAADRWHAEDTTAGKAEIVRLYKKEHPEWN